MTNTQFPDHKEFEKEYGEKLNRYDNILYDFQKTVYKIIKKNPIRFTLKFRVKSFDSYFSKLLKQLKKKIIF